MLVAIIGILLRDKNVTSVMVKERVIVGKFTWAKEEIEEIGEEIEVIEVIEVIEMIEEEGIDMIEEEEEIGEIGEIEEEEEEEEKEEVTEGIIEEEVMIEEMREKNFLILAMVFE